MMRARLTQLRIYQLNCLHVVRKGNNRLKNVCVPEFVSALLLSSKITDIIIRQDLTFHYSLFAFGMGYKLFPNRRLGWTVHGKKGHCFPGGM